MRTRCPQDIQSVTSSAAVYIPMINVIMFSYTPTAEHSIGSFTRQKLQQLDTRPDWKGDEISQLDKMAKSGMYGKPCKALCKAIILRSHWQYHLKHTGDRHSHNCCDGSKRAAPALHVVTSTYSSCVNQPIQQLFLYFQLLMITRSMVVISKMLLCIVPALMSKLICVLIIHILNGGPNVTIKK